MTKKYNLAFAVLAVVTPTFLLAADAPPVEQAMLRIACEGDNANTSISINGKFKGSCPLDVQVPAGLVAVRGVKNAGLDLERVYLQELRLGGDVVRRVEVKLGPARTSSASVQQLAAVEEQEALRSEADQRTKLPSLITIAEGGDATAMFRLGQIYEWGLAGPVDYSKAVQWFGRAAQAGHAAAMTAYADYFRSGRAGTAKDPNQRTVWIQKAAAAGDGDAMYLIGYACRFGDDLGMTKDLALAKQWHEKGALAGSEHAMSGLALLLDGYDEPSDEDTKMAKAWRSRATSVMEARAANGDPRVLLNLAHQYSRGLFGSPNDPNQAEQLFRQSFRAKKKAADTGDIDALLALAQSYEYGKEVETSLGTAINLYQQAKTKGSAKAAAKLLTLESQ